MRYIYNTVTSLSLTITSNLPTADPFNKRRAWSQFLGYLSQKYKLPDRLVCRMISCQDESFRNISPSSPSIRLTTFSSMSNIDPVSSSAVASCCPVSESTMYLCIWLTKCHTKWKLIPRSGAYQGGVFVHMPCTLFQSIQNTVKSNCSSQKLLSERILIFPQRTVVISGWLWKSR